LLRRGQGLDQTGVQRCRIKERERHGQDRNDEKSDDRNKRDPRHDAADAPDAGKAPMGGGRFVSVDCHLMRSLLT
jgi:hypothetical protein